MPNEAGRSGEAGNSTEYKPIQIHTPHPELLQSEKMRGNLPPEQVLKEGKAPGWQKGKFTNQPKRGGGY